MVVPKSTQTGFVGIIYHFQYTSQRLSSFYTCKSVVFMHAMTIISPSSYLQSGPVATSFHAVTFMLRKVDLPEILIVDLSFPSVVQRSPFPASCLCLHCSSASRQMQWRARALGGFLYSVQHAHGRWRSRPGQPAQAACPNRMQYVRIQSIAVCQCV